MRLAASLLLATLVQNCFSTQPLGGAGTVQLFGHSFRLDSSEELQRLAAFVEKLQERSLDQEQQIKTKRERLLADRPLAAMSLDELKAFYAEPKAHIDRKERRGLAVIHDLALTAAEAPGEQRGQTLKALVEVADAVANNDRSPAPSRIELSFAPVFLLRFLYRPVGIGRKPAGNLQSYDSPDLSTIDPHSESFWRRPNSIREQDLYAGFGRPERPRWETNLWSYAGPKTSFGSVPGFEAVADGLHIKAKFLETISEPFTARIFAALGYYAEPTDHAKELKVRYDRRLLREFHLRKDANVQLLRFGVPVMTFSHQHRYDPFEFISRAVLRNGESIGARQLKMRLFRDANRRNPEDDPVNFREDFERQLDYLVTMPANVQLDSGPAKSIGPWDFGHLDHSGRRELRGAALLAAWLGWCDARYENTRLKVVNSGGKEDLRHYFSDLGGGLGKATGFIARETESPEAMTSRFTRPAELCGRYQIARPFRIVNYTPLDDNAAFEALTVDDARWMARLIGQLSRQQIIDALGACDLNAALIESYVSKLVSRRNQMICDLKLENEITPLGISDIVKHSRGRAKKPGHH